MSTYDRAASTALKMLTRYGTTRTYTHVPVSSVSSAGTPTLGTASTTTAKTLVLSPEDGKQFDRAWGASYEPETLARRQARFLWAAASGMAFRPVPGDTVAIGSDTYVILGCDGVPEEQPALYGMGVAK